MADLTVNEKYPDSWRLDHSDFGDVHKTTYAKGVITEFQQTGDDPLKVASMVKVEVDGQETDFLPLFFHPKAQYWDGSDVLATDFNQDEKRFEQAWQSFRCGDEVIVMLREGIPYAVMGFVDSVPRIGEILLHLLVSGHEIYVRTDGDLVGPYGGDWDQDAKGPDGAELHLDKERTLEHIQDLPVTHNYQWTSASGGYGIGGSAGSNLYFQGWPSEEFYCAMGYFWREETINYPEICAINVPIGPILFSIRFLLMRTVINYTLWRYEATNIGSESGVVALPPGYNDPAPPPIDPPGGSVNWTQTTFDSERGRSDFNTSICPMTWQYGSTAGDGAQWFGGYATRVSDGLLQYMTAAGQVGDTDKALTNSDDNYMQRVETYDSNISTVAATIYKDYLKNDPMNSAFIKQTELSTYMWDYLNWWGSDGNPQIFVRPHTKEELQAAGIWPIEEG